MNDVEKKYQDFWKPLVEKDGVVDMEQVKKELFDFATLIDNVAKVYCHVTGNQISKPLTDPDVVISVADEYYDGICQEHIEDMKEAEKC